MHPNDLIRSNLELVASRAPDLTARFYGRLFEQNPQLRPMFNRRTADAQQRMLLEAIVAVVDHLDDSSWLVETLSAMGAKHVEYGVEDRMYPMVASALIATLADVSGDEWSAEVEVAWLDALTYVAETMMAGARQARGEAAERAAE